MSEGILQAGDITLGAVIPLGGVVGSGNFQVWVDIENLLDNLADDDIILIEPLVQLVDSGIEKPYANVEINSAQLLAEIAQGVIPTPLVFFPPVVVKKGYTASFNLTWVQGVPKDIPWSHTNIETKL